MHKTWYRRGIIWEPLTFPPPECKSQLRGQYCQISHSIEPHNAARFDTALLGMSTPKRNKKEVTRVALHWDRRGTQGIIRGQRLAPVYETKRLRTLKSLMTCIHMEGLRMKSNGLKATQDAPKTAVSTKYPISPICTHTHIRMHTHMLHQPQPYAVTTRTMDP